MGKMKIIELEIPENAELEKTKTGYRLVEKDDKIKSWKDLKDVYGYYINNDSKLLSASTSTCNNNKNIFATYGQAKKALAMAQLSQIMKKLNENWNPCWEDNTQEKFTIPFLIDGNGIPFLGCNDTISSYCFLAFKNSELRSYFLSIPEFVQLAKDYYEIEE